jgi:hypothetical protein
LLEFLAKIQKLWWGKIAKRAASRIRHATRRSAYFEGLAWTRKR